MAIDIDISDDGQLIVKTQQGNLLPFNASPKLSALISAGKHFSAATTIGLSTPDGIFLGPSPETGTPLYSAAIDAPARMDWAEAMEYAKEFNHYGHKDWRLPAKSELSILFKNRGLIGGFKSGGYPTGWYWSSTALGEEAAYCQHENGITAASFGYCGGGLSVRYVRG